MEKQDIFYKLVNEGTLILSGLDKKFMAYRVIDLNGKSFRITLAEEKKD